MMRKRRTRTTGFTLVELMVVVVIIGILAGIIVPKFLKRVGPAYEKRIIADFRAIGDAIKMFRMDTHCYPETLRELILKEDEIAGWRGPYLDNPPFDPWKRPYIYEYTGESPKPYVLKTLGADGEEGGKDENKDRSNLDIFQEYASR